VVCGRHSLEVFSLATVLAMICRLAFRTFGVTWTTQLLANGIGLGLMITLALVLERVRRPVKASPMSAAAVTTDPVVTGRSRDVPPPTAAIGNPLADTRVV